MTFGELEFLSRDDMSLVKTVKGSISLGLVICLFLKRFTFGQNQINTTCRYPLRLTC